MIEAVALVGAGFVISFTACMAGYFRGRRARWCSAAVAIWVARTYEH